MYSTVTSLSASVLSHNLPEDDLKHNREEESQSV